MGGGADGQRFRRIRSASRIVFWLGVGAVILFSPASLLFYTDAYQQSGLTLTLPALAAGTAILAIAAYILSFVGDHVQARRELESRLTGGSAHTRPVILLLRSLDGLPLRELTGLFKAMRPLGYAYSSVSRYTLGPAGAARAEKEREFALGGGSYDAEAELDHAIDSRALFVGIGKGHVSCGTAKIVMRDDDRQEMFQRLVEAAFLIFIMPGTSATASELSLILQSRDLQGKAVFIMPGHASARSWALLAEQSAAAGNAKLPNYDANGCYFGLNSEGRPEETAGLKVFTRGLRNYLEANPAALDVTALWKAVEEYQDKNRYLTFMASPQSAADWARRVAATGYIDDAEALIVGLGGNVRRETTGKLVTTSRVTVKVFDDERSFEREQDMVQWVIRDVAPRALSGHSDARHRTPPRASAGRP